MFAQATYWFTSAVSALPVAGFSSGQGCRSAITTTLRVVMVEMKLVHAPGLPKSLTPSASRTKFRLGYRASTSFALTEGSPRLIPAA
jgi:hypothetical protein